MKRIIQIPILVSSILLSKSLSFIISIVLVQSISRHDFGILVMSLSYYEIVIGLTIVILSGAVFYRTRKEQKMKLVE